MFKVTAQADNEAEILLYDMIADFDYEEWHITSAKGFIDKIKALGDVKKINLRINSVGGDVFEALAIYNYLKSHKAKIHVYIDGLAASAASVVAMSGKKITMPSNAMMMIHNPSGGVYGNAEDMRDTAEILDKIRDSIANVYITRTGLEREKINSMMDAETWLSAQEAKDMNFCDEISEPIQIAAKADSESIRRELLLHYLDNDTAKNSKEEANTMPESTQITITNTEELMRAYPDLTREIINAAVNNERERLRVLDSLNAPGREAIIARAKYEEPKDARDIAIELLQADSNNAKLTAMHNDASVINQALTPQVTTPNAKADSERTADLIAKHINAMRGFN